MTSLNSANSVNPDENQGKYRYQRHSISDNRYIPFPLLSVGWYLFRVASDNRYLPRGSNKTTLYISSTGHVFAARWVKPLVTIPLLDFVMIH